MYEGLNPYCHFESDLLCHIAVCSMFGGESFSDIVLFMENGTISIFFISHILLHSVYDPMTFSTTSQVKHGLIEGEWSNRI